MFKKKNLLKFTLFLILSAFFIMVLINIPYYYIINLEDNAVITSEEFSRLKKHNFFNFSVSETVSNNNSDDEEMLKKYEMQYKLFNLFNIKNLKINVVQKSNVFAGGDCLGFTLKSKGLIVVGGNFIITKDGPLNPMNLSGLIVGDCIVKVNDASVQTIDDLTDYLDTLKSSDNIVLTVIRNGEEVKIDIKPALCSQTKKFKLGLWLKDNTIGVGTLTFVNEQSKRFGALGHSISTDNKNVFNITGGDIYQCSVAGVKHAENGNAGQLIGIFSLENDTMGKVDKNSKFGVYGNVFNDAFYKDKRPAQIGGRFTARPGNAKILSCVNGDEIKEFDIEIIKTNYQKSAGEKSMVIRVIDKELIKLTGGIVQGMSGSPIIQNGMLVGAVTHVFLNDSSKGFGLYIDWMLDE